MILMILHIRLVKRFIRCQMSGSYEYFRKVINWAWIMISNDVYTHSACSNGNMREYTFEHEMKFNECISQKMQFTKMKHIKLKFWNRHQMHKIKTANSRNNLVGYSRRILIPYVWSAVLVEIKC